MPYDRPGAPVTVLPGFPRVGRTALDLRVAVIVNDMSKSAPSGTEERLGSAPTTADTTPVSPS